MRRDELAERARAGVVAIQRGGVAPGVGGDDQRAVVKPTSN
jgi:hypothetical protein